MRYNLFGTPETATGETELKTHRGPAIAVISYNTRCASSSAGWKLGPEPAQCNIFFYKTKPISSNFPAAASVFHPNHESRDA
jgi:hypothetical protein